MKVANLNCGSIYKSTNDQFFFTDEDGPSSTLFVSQSEATDGYYIKQAEDYYGSAIRDNSRNQKIVMGKDVDEGNAEEF